MKVVEVGIGEQNVKGLAKMAKKYGGRICGSVDCVYLSFVLSLRAFWQALCTEAALNAFQRQIYK
jgi:hypothetical protein